MSIQDKRVELADLIDNIKKHSDQLSRLETIPILELGVILSKISQLHEKAAILKYLCLVDQKKIKDEVINSQEEFVSQENNESEIDKDSLGVEENLVTGYGELDAHINQETLDRKIDETSSDSKKEYEQKVNDNSDTLLEKNNEASKGKFSQEEDLEDENEHQAISENSTSIEQQQEASAKETTPSPSGKALYSILEESKEKEPLQVKELPEEELIDKIKNEKELNAVPDINEALSEKDESLSNQLQKQPITDLLTAIGLNERYLYSNELFNGDMEEFKNAIIMLNEFKTGEEARAFFENGLRASYEWEDDNVLAQALFNLVERRFQ